MLLFMLYERLICYIMDLLYYTPSSMKSKIREHLKKIGDNSEQTRILIHVFLSSLKF